MRAATPSRLIILIAGLVASTGTASWSQEAVTPKKYLLKEARDAAGNVSVYDQSNGVKIEIFGTPRGVEGAVPRSITLIYSTRDKAKETVLAEDKDGPTLVKRVYSVARTEDSAPGKPAKTSIHVREGKTVTLKRTGQKVLVSLPKGKLPAAEIKQLQKSLMPNDDINFFPDHEVGPGEEWTIDNALLTKKFGAERAQLKARFLDTTAVQGHQCARIALNLQMDSLAGGTPLTWDLQGELLFALDLSRTLSMKLTGPVSMKGTAQNGGVTIDLEGLGTGTFYHTQQWLKVRGKAPAASTPAAVSSPTN